MSDGIKTTGKAGVLTGKHIVIGITGGIAAYKSADLTRRLMEAGAEVRIVMTRAAADFVTSLTFQALSGQAVLVDAHRAEQDSTDESSVESDSTSAGSGMRHIDLARWADAIVIAPASANTIAKLAQGRADNLLTTLCLASQAIKCFAPAMNRVMWQDSGTQANCHTLVKRNWLQFGPASGLQACGETGEGRMMEVSDILDALHHCFNTGELQGLNLTVTAGPTFEAIDPVRYIGNRSSGRMGYAIAQAAQEAGAAVTLISGPSHLPVPPVSHFIAVESAAQMQQAVLDNITLCHIYISAAAVSDYRVAEIAPQKIKKNEDTLTLQLHRNEDIISLVAKLQARPYVVGFAAETEAVASNARSKLQKKNLDMIVANDVSDNTGSKQPVLGFNSDYNALHVMWKQGAAADTDGEIKLGEQHFDIAHKSQLAKQLISLIAQQYRIAQIHHAQDSA